MPKIDINYQIGILLNSKVGELLAAVVHPELDVREFEHENNIVPVHVRLIWVIMHDELDQLKSILAQGVRCDALIINGPEDFDTTLTNHTLWLPKECPVDVLKANIRLAQKRIEQDIRLDTDLSEASDIAILAMKNSSFLGDIIRCMETMADIHKLDDLITTIHKMFNRLGLEISFKIETPDHTFADYKLEDDEELISTLKNSGKMVELPNQLLINLPYISVLFYITDDNKSFLDQARDSISVLTGALSQRIHNIELEEEYQTLEKNKDLILATLSHELKTPLHIIKGFSDRLGRKELDSNFSDRDLICVQKIQENTRQLHDQIEQQLYLYNAMSGNIELYETNMSVDELVEAMQNKFSSRFKEQNIEFNVAVEPNAQFIYIDAEKLNDIVSQLLDNAIKFTEQGRVSLRCYVDQSTADPAILLEVKDTGVGIDAAFQKNLFDPFIQEDMSTKRNFGGCGIGLSLVKALCARLGITISAESEVGVGSTFKLRIPQSSLQVTADTQEDDDMDQDMLLF